MSKEIPCPICGPDITHSWDRITVDSAEFVIHREMMEKRMRELGATYIEYLKAKAEEKTDEE